MQQAVIKKKSVLIIVKIVILLWDFRVLMGSFFIFKSNVLC